MEDFQQNFKFKGREVSDSIHTYLIKKGECICNNADTTCSALYRALPSLLR